MIMFTPLGILLPLLTTKNERFIQSFGISLCFTVGIELLQFVTGKGIFELDDILHNTLGGLIGFFIMMAILICIRRKKFTVKPILKALMIPLCFCLVFVVATIVYNAQEFGNMPILTAEKQDMSLVTIELKAELPEDIGTADVYQNITTNDLQHGKGIASLLANRYELTQSGGVRIDSGNRVFSFKNSTGNGYYLSYVLADGIWTFIDENQGEDVSSEVDLVSQKESMEGWMIQQKLLPVSAAYSVQDERILRWDVVSPENLIHYGDDFTFGMIMIAPSESKIPHNFYYSVNENDYVREVDIISPVQEYQHILDGEFEMYETLVKGDRIIVTGYSLSYSYDTKGFYQPVYVFEGYLNQPDAQQKFSVPAMQKQPIQSSKRSNSCIPPYPKTHLKQQLWIVEKILLAIKIL